MKNNLKTITITLLLITLFACSKENIQPAKHSDKVETNYQQSTFTPSHINPADASSLNQLDLSNPLYADLSQADLKTLKLAEKNLRPFISQNFIYQFQNTKKLKETLNVYNNIIMTLISKHRTQNDQDIKKTLDNYFNLILTDCDQELKGCINLAFFNKDHHNTSSILLSKIQSIDKSIQAKKDQQTNYTEDLVNYYLYLDLAFELKNSVSNELLDAHYIKYSFEYAKHLHSNHKMEKLQEHGSFFENKLKQYVEIADKSKTKNHVLNTINQFNPCHYSKNHQSQFFKYGQPELLGLSSEFMGDSLIKCFSKSMNDNKNVKDRSGDSFLKTIDAIKSQHPDILSSMGMKTTANIFVQFPSYLYIIDNLYRDNWSENDAQSLTDKLNLNNSTILEMVEAYIKYELINTVIQTNVIMHEIYYNDKTVTSKNIYSKAIDENLALINVWQDFNDKRERLKRFALYNLNKNRKEVQVAKYETLFQELDKNIKYIASVPQMMLLTYKMAQKEFKISVMGFVGKVEVDTNEIINKFFQGDFPLWFKFVENTTPLNKMELIYAFDFALKTKVFDNFTTTQNPNKAKISPADFFKVVIGRYLRKTRESVESLLEKSEALNKKNLTQFFKVCQDDHYTLSIPLKDMTFKTLLGNVEDVAKFHNGDMSYPLKALRKNILVELSFVQNLLDLYKLHNPSVQDDIDNETTSIREKLANIYKNIIIFEASTSDCTYKLIEREYAQRNLLIKKEVEYIRSIFDKMIEIEKADPSSRPQLQADFNHQINSTNLLPILKRPPDQEEELFDKITNNYYYFSKLGMLGRLINFLKEINPNIVIDIPGSIQTNDLFQKDKDNTIHGAYLPKDEGSYEQRLQIFTQNVLNKTFNGPTAQIRWADLKGPNTLDYLPNKLSLLVELLKGKRHNLYKKIRKIRRIY